MHLINVVIVTQMLIRTNGMVVHIRQNFFLPFPLRGGFFFFFGFGFLIRSVFVLGFVLGFLGLGSLRNESGRRTMGQHEGRERQKKKKKKKEDGERKRMEEEGKHIELKSLRLEFHMDF